MTEQQNVRIRRLDIIDYDELIELWKRAGLHSLKAQGRDSRASLEKQLASGVQTLLGLEVEGQLLGAIMATHDSRKGWINRLAVDPGHRRNGYGAQLIAAAEDVLHAQGIPVIAALIVIGNAPSLALFQKMGYVEGDPGIHYLTKRENDKV
ncbi:MAG TPA: GNAT family N-acetyltransferase [Chloroflexi bacterium]|nr:GNAT family N-acetyltransferase [Chloroflexota bacterium]